MLVSERFAKPWPAVRQRPRVQSRAAPRRLEALSALAVNPVAKNVRIVRGILPSETVAIVLTAGASGASAMMTFNSGRYHTQRADSAGDVVCNQLI